MDMQTAGGVMACVVSLQSLLIQMLLQVQWSMTWVHPVFIWRAGLARVSRLHQGNFASNWFHAHLTPCWEIHRPMHPGELIMGEESYELRKIHQTKSLSTLQCSTSEILSFLLSLLHFYFIQWIKCSFWWFDHTSCIEDVAINKQLSCLNTYVSQQPTPTGCRQVHCMHLLSIQVSPIE